MRRCHGVDIISIPLRYNLEIDLSTSSLSVYNDFNSTKVQFGVGCLEGLVPLEDISIPLRYNLESK